MKIEEMMLNDWVKFPIGNDRIIGLIYVEGKGICASFSASATLFPVSVSEIEPIPLTSEILEKNGFSNYADSWYFPSDEKNIRIGFHMYETVLDIKTDNASFYKKIPYGYRSIIKYGNILSVHELQHALRLCGINKEIIL